MQRPPNCPCRDFCDCRLFQISVGLAIVLLGGTLNRVMIVELGVDAWLVALMIALPVMFAPFRILVGHRSDHHRSVLADGGGCRMSGWGRYLQFGGFAIMPFALLVLASDSQGPCIRRPSGRRAGVSAGRDRTAHNPDGRDSPLPQTSPHPMCGPAQWRCSMSCSLRV